MVWEWKEGKWCRTGLIPCGQSVEGSLRHKSVAMILDAGVLKASAIPKKWLTTDEVVWCNRGAKAKQPSGFFARGGAYGSGVCGSSSTKIGHGGDTLRDFNEEYHIYSTSRDIWRTSTLRHLTSPHLTSQPTILLLHLTSKE